MRLWTRNGYDCSSRYPRIVEAALRHRPDSFVLDGEAVLLGVDGIADFNALHSRKHDDEVQLYAFDVLMSAGDDLRPLPLHLRKNHLAKMLRRRIEGILLNDFEQGEIGPDLFRHACVMGLEGIVSKHKDQPYRAGRSRHWVKVKNRTFPGDEPARGDVWMKVQACARCDDCRWVARTTSTGHGWVIEPAAAEVREHPVRSATPPT